VATTPRLGQPPVNETLVTKPADMDREGVEVQSHLIADSYALSGRGRVWPDIAGRCESLRREPTILLAANASERSLVQRGT